MIKLYGVNGKIIFESKSKELDISHLPKGVYFIKILSNDSNLIEANKLIVQ